MITNPIIDNFNSNLVDQDNVRPFRVKRQNSNLIISIVPELVDKYLQDGWTIEKAFKTTVRMKRAKSVDLSFEDEVWTIMDAMGFQFLNKDRKFKIPYSDDFNSTQQIDVFAGDSQTLLLIECKAASGEPKKGNFKETIEAIGGRKEGILKFLKKAFPKSKHKVKFILATKNYILSEQDKTRLDNFQIIHFDEEIIEYYRDLTRHLGVSAKYQLLGNLFEGQLIPELDNKIPAIQGKMGGHTYYSFLIEPEKLLKIGYVLHRNKANKKLMPTYQRLIKKSRLKSIQTFVDDKGFFPNSLIININSGKKPVQFDPSSLQVDNAISRIGVLNLPKNYRSAYIIDGQHRLYGYANSIYKDKNSIPVVAFIDLDRKEQVKMFMQINENQKAVPKNLRNTLNSDLLWDSDNLLDQIKALKLQLAQDIGEDLASPLYDRVIIGENPKTLMRCITIDTIKQGLDRSNFFGEFSKTAIRENGTFYLGNNDDTYDKLMAFLIGSFSYIKERLPIEWQKGESEDGFLTINAGIESLIRIFSDIVDHLVKNAGLNAKTKDTDSIVQEIAYYLDPLINYFKDLSVEQKSELRKSYGTGGRARYWRLLQRAINHIRNEFNPEGLAKYWKDEAKAFNEESFKMIRDIETFLKEDFEKKLRQSFGASWMKSGLPQAVYMDIHTRQAHKNLEAEGDEEVSPWDCLNIIDYRKIATYGKNWSEIFEAGYTKPGEEKIRGGKEEKTKWMQKLEKIRNQNFHSYSVKEEEYDFLCELTSWLIEQET